MIKIYNVKTIEDGDWDKLVRETYGRQYTLQQQDDCMPRGQIHISVPNDDWAEDDAEMHDTIPEQVNGQIMGVKFKVWLDRDPKKAVDGRVDSGLELFWDRNFYPHLNVVANDLCNKGLLPKGDYAIEIDW